MSPDELFKGIKTVQKKDECEAKLAVADVGEVVEKILALHPLATETYKEKNRLYQHEGTAFRLRKKSGHENLILTYKGEKKPSLYKKRPEFEADVTPEKARFLVKDAVFLGGYEKRRTVYSLGDDAYVMIDAVVGLGDYIEVEAPDEQVVSSILGKLGLDPAKHISDSYFTLLQKKK
ncbi:class IV adenylate cyclase [Candidatus Woesearchaeota archaeon]|nr:class IV adenylate cyclase [Candidatus Woesearchaeota archaeon]